MKKYEVDTSNMTNPMQTCVSFIESNIQQMKKDKSPFPHPTIFLVLSNKTTIIYTFERKFMNVIRDQTISDLIAKHRKHHRIEYMMVWFHLHIYTSDQIIVRDPLIKNTTLSCVLFSDKQKEPIGYKLFQTTWSNREDINDEVFNIRDQDDRYFQAIPNEFLTNFLFDE